MTNQIPGAQFVGTVSGTGNISLTGVVSGKGSIPVTNLTVGQKAWYIIEAGTGSEKQREIGFGTYTASTPNAGVWSRDTVLYSTSSNATISFASNTSVVLSFDVPDKKIPHFDENDDLILESELATALGLETLTADQSVAAGQVNTLYTASVPEKKIEFHAWEEADPTNRVKGIIYSGPDAGSGSSTAAEAIDVIEGGDLTLEQSGVAFNMRNNSGSAITFSKLITVSRAASS